MMETLPKACRDLTWNRQDNLLTKLAPASLEALLNCNGSLEEEIKSLINYSPVKYILHEWFQRR